MTDKPRFAVIVDEELLKKINDFRDKNDFVNKTQATVALIRIGLACSKNKRKKR